MPTARHDRIWLDALYESNHAAVFVVCSSILRNPEDAADATQQVFLIALESMDPTAKGAVARGWLLTVARNHCLDLLRRRKRLGKALVTLGPDAGAGIDLETAVADRDFVDNVFRHLSERERQALWQSAVEKRPLADIANRLQLSYMAAAQVVHRARRRALRAAARVAVVFGVFHLGRQRPGVGRLLAAHRLAAAAVVPLIVVAVTASSPGRQAAPVVSGAPHTSEGALSGAVQGVVVVSGKLLIATPPALPSVPALASRPSIRGDHGASTVTRPTREARDPDNTRESRDPANDSPEAGEGANGAGDRD